MTDLLDRLSGESLAHVPQRAKIPAHQFVGGLRLYVKGDVSQPEIATNWDLQGDETTQAVSIADAIDALTTKLNKVIFVLELEAIVYLMEDDDDEIYHLPDGTIDKIKVIADAGF